MDSSFSRMNVSAMTVTVISSKDITVRYRIKDIYTRMPLSPSVFVGFSASSRTRSHFSSIYIPMIPVYGFQLFVQT